MAGNIYVSDPRIWDDFYKNMSQQNSNHRTYQYKQIGKGLGNIRKRMLLALVIIN